MKNAKPVLLSTASRGAIMFCDVARGAAAKPTITAHQDDVLVLRSGGVTLADPEQEG